MTPFEQIKNGRNEFHSAGYSWLFREFIDNDFPAGHH